MISYLRGNTKIVECRYTNSSGTLYDPPAANVKAAVREPDGTETTYTYQAGQIAKVSTGIYQLKVLLADVGTYFVRFVSDESHVQVATEKTLHVHNGGVNAL